MSSAITWYDVLGVMPGASTQQILDAYQAKAAILRPERIAGATSKVLAAVDRGQRTIDNALRVLSDPAERRRYDGVAGIERKGTGLVQGEPFASRSAWNPAVIDLPPGAELLEDAFGGLASLMDWFTQGPRWRPRVIVPDVRGLFASVCFDVMRKARMHVATVRLTEHPMPVDGLVVDQSPPAGERVRRFSALTVHVWHPPALPSRGH